MSGIENGRFDTSVYESAQKQLKSLNQNNNSGLETIIKGKGTVTEIQRKEAAQKPKDFEDMEDLLASLDLLNPTSKEGQNDNIVYNQSAQKDTIPNKADEMPDTPKSSWGDSTKGYKKFVNGSPLFQGTPQQQTLQKIPNPLQSPQSPITSVSRPASIQQSPYGEISPADIERQVREIREKLAKTPLELNGKVMTLNKNDFSFERQPNGNYKVQHPLLSRVSDTPIFTDGEGNIQTKSVELKKLYIPFVIDIKGGAYDLAQESGKIQVIAKK